MLGTLCMMLYQLVSTCHLHMALGHLIARFRMQNQMDIFDKLWHLAPFFGIKSPDGHGVHDAWPMESENDPLAHRRHFELPASLNVPGRQGSHLPPAAEK